MLPKFISFDEFNEYIKNGDVKQIDYVTEYQVFASPDNMILMINSSISLCCEVEYVNDNTFLKPLLENNKKYYILDNLGSVLNISDTNILRKYCLFELLKHSEKTKININEFNKSPTSEIVDCLLTTGKTIKSMKLGRYVTNVIEKYK